MSERMRRCFAFRRHDTLVVLFGKIYRKVAKVAKGRGGRRGMWLNIEVEENEDAASLRQGPLSPKVRLKKRLNREWTPMDAKWEEGEELEVMSYTLFGKAKSGSGFMIYDQHSTIYDHFAQRTLGKMMKWSAYVNGTTSYLHDWFCRVENRRGF